MVFIVCEKMQVGADKLYYHREGAADSARVVVAAAAVVDGSHYGGNWGCVQIVRVNAGGHGNLHTVSLGKTQTN